MKRIFWLALGLGAGAAGAVWSLRFMKRTARQVPQSLVREARGGVLDLSRLVSESIAEGKRAMAEKEDELRSRLD